MKNNNKKRKYKKTQYQLHSVYKNLNHRSTCKTQSHKILRENKKTIALCFGGRKMT